MHAGSQFEYAAGHHLWESLEQGLKQQLSAKGGRRCKQDNSRNRVKHVLSFPLEVTGRLALRLHCLICLEAGAAHACWKSI